MTTLSNHGHRAHALADEGQGQDDRPLGDDRSRARDRSPDDYAHLIKTC
jgi:hypothetical protein